MHHPNIVLFLTDDHAPWTLPEYGNRELKTPHFSRLAAEGVLFRNAFTPCPVCSPARACLMTGRTPSQVGIHDWLEEGNADIAALDRLSGEATLAELLQRAGYQTFLSGKWHLGQSHHTPRGFDHCFGIGGGQGIHNGSLSFHQDGVPLELEGNKSRIITDKAVEFLEAATGDEPFFLNISYIATHSPYQIQAHEPHLADKVQDFDFVDIPAYIPHPWAKNEGLNASQESNDQVLRDRYRGYYAAVMELDHNVGRIMEALEQRGLLDDTIIIYASDHGCSLGQNGFWGKGNSTRPLNMYEVSLRIPLLIRGPQISPGHIVDLPVDHYDLFQAICEWGGVPRFSDEWESRHYPGTSLAPLAGGRTVPAWQQERYGEYGDLRMIRTEEFKLVHRYPNGPHDLYHLTVDPGETRNLAGDSDYAAVQQELTTRLEQWYSQHEDPRYTGLRVKSLPPHNMGYEAWRDGIREARGLQVS